MDEAARGSSRRGFVARAGLFLAALGGAAGAGVTLRSRGGDAVDAAPAAGERTTLYARNWRAQAPGERFGERPKTGQSLHLNGELVDAAGRQLGDLRGTAVPIATPFAESVSALFETHVLSLAEGTLVGMGTVVDDEPVFAIVGGTGRYAGARGSYAARSRPSGLGGDGTAEIVIDLKL